MFIIILVIKNKFSNLTEYKSTVKEIVGWYIKHLHHFKENFMKKMQTQKTTCYMIVFVEYS